MTTQPTLEQYPLVSRTEPFHAGSAETLVALLPPARSTELMAWVRGGDGIIGWGRALSRTAYGQSRFRELDSWWHEVCATAVVRDTVGLRGSGPIAFGSIAYAADSPTGATLIVPEVVVGCRDGRWWVSMMSAGQLPETASVHAQPAPRSPGSVTVRDGALTTAQWRARVEQALGRIGEGELDKVVLARDLRVSTEAPIDVRYLLRELSARYPSTWVYAVDALVGATPEMLVRREKGLVTSRVLAGTIRRTGDDEHDLTLAASLARSSKDLEEHEYAVRSVADLLAPHCSSLNVPETPSVLHLANVMHLATDVTGVLTDRLSSLALAGALHPSAAVCGTPTATADAVITELEQLDRGRYAGPVGWMDATGDGEWGIALRCGAIDADDPRQIQLYAGCGIVAGSVPEHELAESDAKLMPMRDALTNHPSPA